MRLIQAADTFFLGSYYAQTGTDITHRGGLPGFIRVLSSSLIVWPEYVGNGMHQTQGNLTLDTSAGLLFVDWERHVLLQLTGKAQLVWVSDEREEGGGLRAGIMDGRDRYIHFTVEAVRETAQVVPFDYSLLQSSPYNPALSQSEEMGQRVVQAFATTKEEDKEGRVKRKSSESAGIEDRKEHESGAAATPAVISTASSSITTTSTTVGVSATAFSTTTAPIPLAIIAIREEARGVKTFRLAPATAVPTHDDVSDASPNTPSSSLSHTLPPVLPGQHGVFSLCLSPGGEEIQRSWTISATSLDEEQEQAAQTLTSSLQPPIPSLQPPTPISSSSSSQPSITTANLSPTWIEITVKLMPEGRVSPLLHSLSNSKENYPLLPQAVLGAASTTTFVLSLLGVEGTFVWNPASSSSSSSLMAFSPSSSSTPLSASHPSCSLSSAESSAQPRSRAQAVFFAAGVGVTPAVAMARHLCATREEGLGYSLSSFSSSSSLHIVQVDRSLDADFPFALLLSSLAEHHPRSLTYTRYPTSPPCHRPTSHDILKLLNMVSEERKRRRGVVFMQGKAAFLRILGALIVFSSLRHFRALYLRPIWST